MDKELKQKWIDALLSGKYEQGTQTLRTLEDEFCCLGTLCDIVDPNGWQANPENGAWEWVDYNPGKDYTPYDPDDEFSTNYDEVVGSLLLPESLANRVFASDVLSDPTDGGNHESIDPEGDEDTLAGFNDNGSSFKEIAFIIERDF